MSYLSSKGSSVPTFIQRWSPYRVLKPKRSQIPSPLSPVCPSPFCDPGPLLPGTYSVIPQTWDSMSHPEMVHSFSSYCNYSTTRRVEIYTDWVLSLGSFESVVTTQVGKWICTPWTPVSSSVRRFVDWFVLVLFLSNRFRSRIWRRCKSRRKFRSDEVDSGRKVHDLRLHSWQRPTKWLIDAEGVEDFRSRQSGRVTFTPGVDPSSYPQKVPLLLS